LPRRFDDCSPTRGSERADDCADHTRDLHDLPHRADQHLTPFPNSVMSVGWWLLVSTTVVCTRVLRPCTTSCPRAIFVSYADDFIELALRIQQVIAVANRAIGRMREEVREPQRRFAQVRLAS
jgi:hypothetical protein